MSKVKKVLAMILSMAMILGMSLTTFAAPANPSVRVNNLEEGSTVKAVQVIKPSEKTDTGWAFTSQDIANAYITAFNLTGQENADQLAIWALIKYVDADFNAAHVTVPEGVPDITTTDILNALDRVQNIDNGNIYDINATVSGTTATFNVTAAGVYAIMATAKTDSDTIYNPMAAYVNFEYNEDGTPVLTDETVEVNAKKSDVPVEKEVLDEDKATGISETVTYQVTTAVPFFGETKEWMFTDTITNARYDVVPEGTEDPDLVDHIGQLPVNIVIGNGEVNTTEFATVTNNSFTLDLTKYVTETNAGKTVVISYKAVVTGLEVSNEIKYDDEHKSDEVKLYTGSIVLTKYDDEDTPNKLGGAGFKVSRTGNDNVTQYATFAEQADGTYQLTGWVSNMNDATEIFTNNNPKFSGFGTLTVTGLDVDEYHFTETTAPEGYTINDDGVDVNLTLSDEVEATKAFSTTGSITDTKLSSLPLPSTGGMGTTIFTIGGCVIMIAAAGLYFASRRKQENK